MPWAWNKLLVQNNLGLGLKPSGFGGSYTKDLGLIIGSFLSQSLVFKVRHLFHIKQYQPEPDNYLFVKYLPNFVR
jgi:hypothetical protein